MVQFALSSPGREARWGRQGSALAAIQVDCFVVSRSETLRNDKLTFVILNEVKNPFGLPSRARGTKLLLDSSVPCPFASVG